MGILLPPRSLQRIIRGRPTNEAALEYALAAERLGLRVVLFTLKGLDLRRRLVHGYVWTGSGWQSWSGPLPRAVHNRVLASRPRELAQVRALHRALGPGFFNPPLVRDKWRLWQELSQDPGIAPHLPPTWPLTRAVGRRAAGLAGRYGCLFAKPRVGSLGLGIVVIEPRPGGRFRLVRVQGRSRIVGRRSLNRLMQRLAARGSYLLQSGVPLITYAGRRCDIRVPVQRAGDGEWHVVTPTVKRADRHRYITNIARGGQALPFRTVAEAAFGPERARHIEEDVARLARRIAEYLSRRRPHLADLGLDVGLDAGGKPWLIEVNFRDQRLVPRAAKLATVHAELYHNPIAYAHYLLQRFPAGGAGVSGAS